MAPKSSSCFLSGGKGKFFRVLLFVRDPRPMLVHSLPAQSSSATPAEFLYASCGWFSVFGTLLVFTQSRRVTSPKLFWTEAEAKSGLFCRRDLRGPHPSNFRIVNGRKRKRFYNKKCLIGFFKKEWLFWSPLSINRAFSFAVWGLGKASGPGADFRPPAFSKLHARSGLDSKFTFYIFVIGKNEGGRGEDWLIYLNPRG